MKKLGVVVALCVVVGLLFAFQAVAADKPADAKTPAADVKKETPAKKEAAPAKNVVYHGNVNSKVFHQPGCQHYDCKNCTEKFASKEDAVKAGYKPDKCVK